MCKLDSNILFFFYISVLPDELNVGDHRHCVYCTSLLASSCCTCIQCGDCGIYSISKDLHKCRKNPTYCKNELCKLMIKSSTNLCQVCQLDEIKAICEMITPSSQNNTPQCLRCLSDIINNTPCTCKACNTCKMYFPVNKPHINCKTRTTYCEIRHNTIIRWLTN